MHGTGTHTFANGNIYIGELINGKRHGQGTAIWSNGDKYEGNWINDLRNGYGISISVSGNKYLGEHKEGFRHGQGTYIWADGSVWEGIWKDGELSDGKRYAIGEYNYSNNYSNLPNCPGSPALISNIENTPFWSGCYGIINFDTGEFKGHRSEAEYLNNMALLNESVGTVGASNSWTNLRKGANMPWENFNYDNRKQNNKSGRRDPLWNATNDS